MVMIINGTIMVGRRSSSLTLVHFQQSSLFLKFSWSGSKRFLLSVLSKCPAGFVHCSSFDQLLLTMETFCKSTECSSGSLSIIRTVAAKMFDVLLN